MTTITLWLLVSIGTFGGQGATNSPTFVIERFATEEACRSAWGKLENAYRTYVPRLVCIKADVVDSQPQTKKFVVTL